MTRTFLLELHKALCEKARAITEAKNQDYAHESSVFGNLDQIEHRSAGRRTTEEGILVRIDDKVARLWNLVLNGSLAVKDESAEDTLLDIINYCILLRAKQLSRTRDYPTKMPPTPSPKLTPEVVQAQQAAIQATIEQTYRRTD